MVANVYKVNRSKAGLMCLVLDLWVFVGAINLGLMFVLGEGVSTCDAMLYSFKEEFRTIFRSICGGFDVISYF